MVRVAVLEAFDAVLQAVIRGHVGDGLELIFAASNADADRARALATAEHAVVRGVRVAARLPDAAPNLRLLHQWGTGTDHLPVAAALARGIMVARSPGRNAPTVADMTVGLMLACLRRIPQSDARRRAGDWADENPWTVGRDLTGARVGLRGYGAIAQQVARRPAGFDCDTAYTRASGPMAGVPGFRALEDLLGWADIVSLHLPLTPDTGNLLSSERLARMRPGAILINTARGGG